METSIYWHGSNSDFSEGFESATERGEGSGARSKGPSGEELFGSSS